jgi:hypothetical protein
MREGTYTATWAVVFALVFSSGGFFGWPITAYASPDYLVISQVQITSGTGQTNNDFVEIFNPTATAIDLQGYRLVKRTAAGTTDITLVEWTNSAIVPAYRFYLSAHSSYTNLTPVADTTFVTGTSANLAPSNGVALRQGAENTGTIIDSVAWGTVTNIFAEGTIPKDPGDNKSLIRKTTSPGSRQDTNDNNNDFPLPTTSVAPHNSATAPEIPTDNPPPASSGSNGGTVFQAPSTPQPGEIVINEFVSDPADGQEELIELYNRSSKVIDLSSWTMEDGGKAITTLSGSLGTDGASRYLTILSPKGNLNNDGDQITLKYGDTIIDQIAYGNWDDGNISNNAPVTRDPFSMGRLPNGTDSGNDATDFIIMDPSSSQENTAPATNLQINESSNNQVIDFNEVYPNPPLGDEANEFIELINLSNQAVDLKNWLLADDEGTNYIITPADWLTTIIESGKFLLLPRPKTGIALDNNGTEKLALTSPDGKTKIKLFYEGLALEGASYARDDEGVWQWTITPTPGNSNNIKIINKAPLLALDMPKTGTIGELLAFDASDTVDPEQDVLSFNWDFGDGYASTTITPSHIFAKTGRFTVRLSIKDSVGNESKESKIITISTPETKGVVAGVSSGILELSEFIPNPVGSDDNEWVEIFNPSNLTVSTAGWKLKMNDRNTNLPVYEIPAEGYLIIPKSEAHFSLINKGGLIALESPAGEALPSVEYGTAPEGSSFARNENGWSWTTLPTPGGENVITTENENGDDYQLYPLADLKTLESGTHVTVEGVVAANPGLLGKNILFLAGSGIQVNLSGENLPTIKIGDQIRIVGTLSRTASSGSKIVMRSSDKIAILGQGDATTPLNLPLGEISEEQEGELVITTGIVNQASATSFVINKDGDSLRVALKNQELKWPKIIIGTEVTVTGFVNISRSSVRLLARSPEDIIIKQAPPQTTTLDLSAPANNTNWQGYLFLGLLAILLTTAYFWEKFKLPSPFILIKKYLQKRDT